MRTEITFPTTIWCCQIRVMWPQEEVSSGFSCEVFRGTFLKRKLGVLGCRCRSLDSASPKLKRKRKTISCLLRRSFIKPNAPINKPQMFIKVPQRQSSAQSRGYQLFLFARFNQFDAEILEASGVCQIPALIRGELFIWSQSPVWSLMEDKQPSAYCFSAAN